MDYPVNYPVTIHYGNEEIPLSYHPKLSSIERNFPKISVKGYGKRTSNSLSDKEIDECYETAEQEAQVYIVKNSIDKIRDSRYHLKRITAIQEEVNCSCINEHFEIQIRLEGIAILEANHKNL